jgi:ribonuclease P protein component
LADPATGSLPRAADGAVSGALGAQGASGTRQRLQHIEHRAQFQWVMAGPPVVKTAHFALHLAAPQAPAGGTAQAGALSRPLFTGAGPWVGVVIPKRWAKRAVTRNMVKRQIYALAQERLPLLPCAGLVVRLRSGFDRKQFISATSDALKAAVRTELQLLYGRLLERKHA